MAFALGALVSSVPAAGGGESQGAAARGLGPRQPGLRGSDPDSQEVALSLLPAQGLWGGFAGGHILPLAWVPGLRRAMQQHQVLRQQGHGRVLAQPDRNGLFSTVGGAGGM